MNSLSNSGESSSQKYCVSVTMFSNNMSNSECQNTVIGYVNNVNEIQKMRIGLELVSSDEIGNQSKFFDLVLNPNSTNEINKRQHKWGFAKFIATHKESANNI